MRLVRWREDDGSRHEREMTTSGAAITFAVVLNERRDVKCVEISSVFSNREADAPKVPSPQVIEMK
jgi:hypothetical protein